MGDRRVQFDHAMARGAKVGGLIKRVGLVGLLFFFFKGLAWMSVGAIVWLGSRT